MHSIILALLLAACAGTAVAQTTFSLDPAQAGAGQNVNLRIDNPAGCYPAPQIDVLRAGNIVTVNLLTTDAGPCLPEWATPRFVSLGTFSPGSYQVQSFVCSNPPPPVPACQLRATLMLTILGTGGARFTVPTLSAEVAAGLMLLMLVAALASYRR